LTDALKTAFPHISPVARPIVKGLVVQNPYWISGFTSGVVVFLFQLESPLILSQGYL
jgi:hypothetical protein